MRFPVSVVEHYLTRSGYKILASIEQHDIPVRFATVSPQSARTSFALLVCDALPEDANSVPCGVIRLDEERSTDILDALPNNYAAIRTSKSAQQICDEINLFFSQIEEWRDQMDSIAFKGGRNAELLESSEPFLGLYVGLSDALFAHVAHTPGIEPIESMSRSLVEKGHYPDNMIRAIESTAMRQDWAHQAGTKYDPRGSLLNPFPAANRIFTLNGHYAAHLVTVSKTSISPGQLFLFDLLADSVELCLQQHWAKEEQFSGKGTEFLHALLNGEFADIERLYAQAVHFKIPKEGLFELCVVDGAAAHGGVSHFAKRIADDIPNSAVCIQDNKIYVLLRSTGTAGEIAHAEKYLTEMAKNLEAEVGISNKFMLLEYASISKMEADIALEFGRKHAKKYTSLLDEDPDLFCVYRFKRYFPCFIADPEADTARFIELFKSGPHPVNLMLANDRERGTEDFTLLKLYLFYDCNIKRTAARLGMHRNSVTYRLDKIKNDYNIDLDDDDERLFLHFVFAVID